MNKVLGLLKNAAAWTIYSGPTKKCPVVPVEYKKCMDYLNRNITNLKKIPKTSATILHIKEKYTCLKTQQTIFSNFQK